MDAKDISEDPDLLFLRVVQTLEGHLNFVRHFSTTLYVSMLFLLTSGLGWLGEENLVQELKHSQFNDSL